jgi:hypothetical protein
MRIAFVVAGNLLWLPIAVFCLLALVEQQQQQPRAKREIAIRSFCSLFALP